MRFTLLVAATLLCSALMAGSAAAQTRYPLACRGGGDMNVNIAPQASGGGTEIVIGFARATVTTSIPAGSCTWLDRTMNDREPRSLRIIVRARMNVDFRPRPGTRDGDRARGYVYPGSGPDEALANTIMRVLRDGGSFTVQAYNPGAGSMNAIDFRETAAR
jgi:hypothetical protein